MCVCACVRVCVCVCVFEHSYSHAEPVHLATCSLRTFTMSHRIGTEHEKFGFQHGSNARITYPQIESVLKVRTS
jgi:gamma-glutamylcysteine synthetase